ncbi:MAG TPA: sulfotransferase family 2 domain-containing protein [Bacteroidales bacterium]|nr:sulfotransferase family 2 domain-containing protein [Bacteroidales bacterium]
MKYFWRNKIIYFLHIYKTGGTTLNDLLFKNFSSNEIVNLYIPYISTGQLGEIFKVRDNLQISGKTKIIYGHYAYGIHYKYSHLPYTYMCYVRDPFTRLVSTYYHLLRMDPDWQFQILSRLSPKYPSLEHVIENLPGFNEYADFKGLQNQQCMFITGETPAVIEKDQVYYAKMAIDNLDRDFSFIGLQEEFEESLQRIKKILKLKTTEYAYKNLGTNKPESIENLKNLKEIVYEKSRADCLIYEYAKKRFYS